MKMMLVRSRSASVTAITEQQKVWNRAMDGESYRFNAQKTAHLLKRLESILKNNKIFVQILVEFINNEEKIKHKNKLIFTPKSC